MKAVRDNGRLTLEDAEYAEHLWVASGLERIFASLPIGSRHACGLNANIRLYRWSLTFGIC